MPRVFGDIHEEEFLFSDGHYTITCQIVKSRKDERDGTITFDTVPMFAGQESKKASYHNILTLDPETDVSSNGLFFANVEDCYQVVKQHLNDVEEEYKIYQMHVESAYMELPQSELDKSNKTFSMLHPGDVLYKLAPLHSKEGMRTIPITTVDTIDNILYIDNTCILGPKKYDYTVMMGTHLFSNGEKCYQYAVDMLNAIYSNLDQYKQELEILYCNTKRNNNCPII